MRFPVLAFSTWTLFSQGMGDLMVAPTRVILEGRVRSAEVTVVNRGAGKATFRASLVEMDMEEDGRLKERPKRPHEICASDLVRFAPRQMELAPGASQVVRIQARKPAGLPAGEYRSHMVFQSLPSVDAMLSPDQGPDAFSVSLKPIFGVSIPLIVRHQGTDVDVLLSDLKVDAQPDPSGGASVPVLALRLNRKGNQTAYGDLSIYFLPEGGGEMLVGEARGVAVYQNVASRLVKVALREWPPRDRKKGRLRVSYRYQEFQKPAVIATLDNP